MVCAKHSNNILHNFPGLFCSPLTNEAGQRLIEFCQENSLVIANTTGGDCSHENKGRLLLGRKAMINLDSI